MLKVYSIRDAKIESYGPPFFCRAKGEAIRMFQDLLNDGQSLPSKYPGDFDLYEIGTYDDATGVLAAVPHVACGKGLDFKRLPEETAPLFSGRPEVAPPQRPQASR